MSGYILFSSEMRAVIKARHPDFSFGELSRLVGTEWRNLEAYKKAEYEGAKQCSVGGKLPECALKSRLNISVFCRTCSQTSGATRTGEATPEASVP